MDHLITAILKAEGWDAYTNHPADKGGPTKWGITLAAWEGYVGTPVLAADVKEITEQQARAFYAVEYIIKPGFDDLPPMIQDVVVDSGVNSGVRIASKWVQRAVKAKQDGRIGPQTLKAVSLVSPDAIYLRVLAYRIKLYGRLVTHGKQLKAAKAAGFRLQAEFASGWNNRAAGFLLSLADTIDAR